MLLREFRVSRNHQAIVIDEHGGISGLVTMEDVLEQIVGDIEDEFDETEEDSIFPEGENQWRVRAATEISHFNDVFGSKLPDDEYDSVGGWMGGRLGRIPRRGDHAEIDGLRIEVARGDARRALWLRVRRLAGPHSAPIPPKHEPHPRGRLLRGAAGLTLAGAAHALTFAPGPLPGWALAITQVLALAVAARVTLYAPSARQSWARGWLFSFATYALGLYWIFISLHRYGDLAAPLAAPPCCCRPSWPSSPPRLRWRALCAAGTGFAARPRVDGRADLGRPVGRLRMGARGAAHRLSLAEHRLCPCR